MEIKRISLNQAQPGMLSAEDVYNSDNQLIFPAKGRLTEKAITRLRFHSVPFIRIVIEDNTVIPPENGSSTSFENEESYFEKLKDTEEYQSFNNNFTDVATAFERELKGIVEFDAQPNPEPLADEVLKILHSCRSGIQVFDLLHCSRNYDEVVFAHSLNVALISSVLGSWLNFSEPELRLLVKCAIYHDIGKLAIPKEIVNKPSPLTPDEYQVMKSHSMKGYAILKNLNMDKHIQLAAMMHHERCDGSGYPLGVKAEKMDSYSKIIAIADVYEAMTAPRSYRKAKCPFEAVKIFESNGLALYDTKFLMTFLDHITQCYMGYRVRLDDGTIGTIIFTNRQAFSRPMIQVGEKYVDLSKVSGKSIVEIL